RARRGRRSHRCGPELLLAQSHIADVPGQQVDRDVSVDIGVRARVVEQIAAAEAGVYAGVGAEVDAGALTEVDLTAKLHPEDQGARVHRCCAVTVDRRRGLPRDETLPG